MQLLRKRAFARAGLIGNPSDGYHGKTLSISVRNFWADAVLYEWDQIELVLSQEDRSRFGTVEELVGDVERHGYYGGVRLVKATIKKFVEYCHRQGHALHDRTFSIRYESNIPRQVGLAGSSAIIVATLRCLMEFYDVCIPRQVQPSLALSVETDELGISAGLQDRVIQVYEGLVAMDFSTESMQQVEGYACGRYEPLDPALLPPLYLAYREHHSGPTERVHNDLRARFDRGDADVVDAMHRLAQLADRAKQAIAAQDHALLSRLIDENFDIRRSICTIPTGQAEMVDTARRAGATAKFSGSGGAILGTYPNPSVYERLTTDLAALDCPLLTPQITTP